MKDKVFIKQCTAYSVFKIMKIVISCLILPFFTIAQINYSGTISDKNGKNKISYATVGLIKENIGTNADENGNFSLQSIGRKTNDSLIISSVGYETLKIAIDKLPPNMQFELEVRTTTLKEFVVNINRKLKTTTLNEASNCGTNYYTTSGYMTQMAQHFHADNADAILSEVEICKYGIAIIDPVKTKFRIRIYGMDTVSGKPATDLTDSSIEVKVEGRHVVVNLEKYKIFIPGQDFFVAVEWLKIPFNAYREKTKMNGQKTFHTVFTPSLAVKIRDRKDISPPQTHEVWMQNYTGRWTPMDNVYKMMIAATIKY